jgi:hypothetical protein
LKYSSGFDKKTNMRCTSFSFMSQNIVTVLYFNTVGKLQPVITVSNLLTSWSYLQLCPQCKVFLSETLPEYWIGEGGPLNWLAHSTNLTAMGFYLWGFLIWLVIVHGGWFVKGKAVPLQTWGGPEGSRKLRFPDFMTTAQDGGKVVSLMHRPPLPPGNTPRKYSWYSFLLEAESTPGP